MNHYVYEIENNINHKKYIGKHSCEGDFLDSDYYGSGTLIKRAIQKYGKDNFSRKVIGKYNTEQEAYDAEQDFILNCKADERSNYYNLCKGGHIVNCGKKAIPVNRIVPYGNSHFTILEKCLCVDDTIDMIIKNEEYQPSFDVMYYIGYLINTGYSKYEIKEIIYAKYYYYDNLILDKCISKMYLLSDDELKFLYSTHQFNIYIPEINRINKIKSKKKRIFSIVLLLIYKAHANSNNEYVYFNKTHISHFCGSGIGKDETNEILDYLSDNHIFELNDKKDKFRVPFAIFDSEDIFTNIKKITKTTRYVLDLYNGENIVKCEQCGDYIRGNKNGTKKYCNVCLSYTLKKGKIKLCIDCGKYFSANPRNHKSCRCEDCYTLYRANKKLETQRIRREKLKLNSPKSA